MDKSCAGKARSKHLRWPLLQSRQFILSLEAINLAEKDFYAWRGVVSQSEHSVIAPRVIIRDQTVDFPEARK